MVKPHPAITEQQLDVLEYGVKQKYWTAEARDEEIARLNAKHEALDKKIAEMKEIDPDNPFIEIFENGFGRV